MMRGRAVRYARWAHVGGADSREKSGRLEVPT